MCLLPALERACHGDAWLSSSVVVLSYTVNAICTRGDGHERSMRPGKTRAL